MIVFYTTLLFLSISSSSCISPITPNFLHHMLLDLKCFSKIISTFQKCVKKLLEAILTIGQTMAKWKWKDGNCRPWISMILWFYCPHVTKSFKANEGITFWMNPMKSFMISVRKSFMKLAFTSAIDLFSYTFILAFIAK